MVWGSRTHQFPNATHHDFKATYNLDVIDFNAPDVQHPLTGEFYITVEAESLTTYTVLLITGVAMVGNPAHVDEERPSYIMLNDGVP